MFYVNPGGIIYCWRSRDCKRALRVAKVIGVAPTWSPDVICVRCVVV